MTEQDLVPSSVVASKARKISPSSVVVVFPPFVLLVVALAAKTAKIGLADVVRIAMRYF